MPPTTKYAGTHALLKSLMHDEKKNNNNNLKNVGNQKLFFGDF